MSLAENKVTTILSKLNIVIRMDHGVTFKQTQKLVRKLHHALIGIPTGHYLIGPINRLMASEPKLVY